MIEIPASFWKLFTDEQFFDVCEASALNKAQCKQLWAHLGRTDRPPKILRISVNADQLIHWLIGQMPPIAGNEPQGTAQ